MELTDAVHHRKLCQLIIDGFLHFTHILVVHLQSNLNIQTESTKNELLFSACILINYMKDLPDDYYKWHKLEKSEVFDMIIIKTGKTNDINNYSTNPIIGDKNNIAEPIIVNNIHKVFLPCTIIICRKLTNDLTTAEHHQVLKTEIRKKKQLKELTAATADGLDKIANKQNHAKLVKIINKRVDKVSAKAAQKIAFKTQESSSKNFSSTSAEVTNKMRKNYQGAQKSHPPVAPLKRKSGEQPLENQEKKQKSTKKMKTNSGCCHPQHRRPSAGRGPYQHS